MWLWLSSFIVYVENLWRSFDLLFRAEVSRVSRALSLSTVIVCSHYPFRYEPVPHSPNTILRYKMCGNDILYICYKISSPSPQTLENWYHCCSWSTILGGCSSVSGNFGLCPNWSVRFRFESRAMHYQQGWFNYGETRGQKDRHYHFEPLSSYDPSLN